MQYQDQAFEKCIRLKNGHRQVEEKAQGLDKPEKQDVETKL